MINQPVNKSVEIEERTYQLSYLEAFEATKREVDKALSASPPLIGRYLEHIRKASGKFIRAKSLLACSMDMSNNVHPNAVKLAAAVEILHLATLVHDDVIDDAEVRRGVVTLHRKYGRKTAIICGDYLLALALRTASGVENAENYVKFNFPDYVSRICLGELNQHINNGNLDLSVYKYLKIISGKTAALFEASFLAGAVIISENTSVHRDYMRLGRYVGMIFQLTDDCIDYEDTEASARKTVRSDFEQGVITLPLIFAFANEHGLKVKAAQNALSKTELARLVIGAGGIKQTRVVARKYYDKAVKVIDRLDMTEEKRHYLMEILDKAYHGTKKR
ncbi:MAG: polyprenyl synthetase family protein [Clostridiales bacterium]|nr:polyprenyl synthetase family protein [Clostridiales bacterium]